MKSHPAPPLNALVVAVYWFATGSTQTDCLFKGCCYNTSSLVNGSACFYRSLADADLCEYNARLQVLIAVPVNRVVVATLHLFAHVRAWWGAGVGGGVVFVCVCWCFCVSCRDPGGVCLYF